MRQNLVVAFVALAIIGIGGYWYVLNSKSAGREPQLREFTLKVVNKKLVEGSGALAANQGDTVVIHITCDEEEELHLHGYDRSVDLEPGKEGNLTLTADVAGNFPFELEKSKTELGALQVQPN